MGEWFELGGRPLSMKLIKVLATLLHDKFLYRPKFNFVGTYKWSAPSPPSTLHILAFSQNLITPFKHLNMYIVACLEYSFRQEVVLS